jgi:hypothetical protein
MTDLQRFEAGLPMFVGKRFTYSEVTGKEKKRRSNPFRRQRGPKRRAP